MLCSPPPRLATIQFLESDHLGVTMKKTAALLLALTVSAAGVAAADELEDMM